MGTFEEEEPDSPFVIRGSYLDPEPKLWESDRDGIRMTFRDQAIPLERYSRAFEAAGLLIEAVREPRPPEAFVRRRPTAARWLRVPLFLQPAGGKALSSTAAAIVDAVTTKARTSC